MSIIERLEAATEGSRELDEAIQQLFNPARHAWNEAETERLIQAARGNGLTDRNESCRRSAFYSTPRYTTSIDAALTLLPEGAMWRLGHDGEGQDPGYIKAEIANCGHAAVGHSYGAALALCIAALKARELKEGK